MAKSGTARGRGANTGRRRRAATSQNCSSAQKREAANCWLGQIAGKVTSNHYISSLSSHNAPEREAAVKSCKKSRLLVLFAASVYYPAAQRTCAMHSTQSKEVLSIVAHLTRCENEAVGGERKETLLATASRQSLFSLAASTASSTIRTRMKEDNKEVSFPGDETEPRARTGYKGRRHRRKNLKLEETPLISRPRAAAKHTNNSRTEALSYQQSSSSEAQAAGPRSLSSRSENSFLSLFRYYLFTPLPFLLSAERDKRF